MVTTKEQAGIKRQIELPWRQAIKMATDSIRVRFWRSMITAAGIFLGIAFLMTVLTGSAVLEARQEQLKEGVDVVLKQRQNWLVVMSLLVSTVGVVNSMLMSVTERYREIGTMKCLGALDRLVVKVFLIEAGITGLIASAAGTVVGFLVMLLMYWVRFGNWLFSAVGQKSSVLVSDGLQCLLIGTVLALMAAFYPAWRAAKMPPAAALRSDF